MLRSTTYNMKDRNNVNISELIDSLPQASHTMTWSIISHNEPDTMAEDYIGSEQVSQSKV